MNRDFRGTRTAFSGMHIFPREHVSQFSLSPYIVRGERSLRFYDAAEAAKRRGDPPFEPAARRIAWLISPPLTPCPVCRRRRRSCCFEDRRKAQRRAYRALKATLVRGSTREALEEGLSDPILPSCYTGTSWACQRHRRRSVYGVVGGSSGLFRTPP